MCFLIYASGQTVCCITVERFCSIRMPARYRVLRTKRKICIPIRVSTQYHSVLGWITTILRQYFAALLGANWSTHVWNTLMNGFVRLWPARVDGHLYDVDNSSRRLLHVHHRLAVLRRASHCPAGQVLRSVHGRRCLQLHPAGERAPVSCFAPF